VEILGLVGSPRTGGNTDILMDVVLDGAQANNHRVKKLCLRDFDIGPCIDCRGCKKGERTCVLDDGMNELYERLDSADVIVFGTPV
jgi:multimeric flavodoxin WrbA